MKKYESLKSEYPERISLDQLYKICNVSKATARYLVQNGIIPCVENKNNKTWKYEIALDDVITYLLRREQSGSMIPKGAVSRKKYPSKKSTSVVPQILTSSERSIQAYFKARFSAYPDVLTIQQVAFMTGLCDATISRLIKRKALKALPYNRGHVVPKEWLMEFVKSEEYLKFRGLSEEFKNVINDFEKWKTK